MHFACFIYLFILLISQNYANIDVRKAEFPFEMSQTRKHTHAARDTHTKCQIDSKLLHKFDSLAIFICSSVRAQEKCFQQYYAEFHKLLQHNGKLFHQNPTARPYENTTEK